MYDYIRVNSPLGRLTLAAEDEKLFALVLDGQKYADRHLRGEGREGETPVLRQTAAWLERYFAGEKPSAAELPLAPRGSEFQHRVWQELLTIPYGTHTSYGALAQRLGSSARAVAGAVGRNPLLIVLPCHRVLTATASLGGFAAGLEAKRKLLALEAG